MKKFKIELNDTDLEEIVISEMKTIYKNCSDQLTRMGALAILQYYMTSFDFEQWSKGQ